ncbi:fatty acid--CoA ligase family protein [Streptomyces sp. BK205]|uniref:class I adenylate-forming enzyme family protein n=1 Tax=Streptomyces sp. BK205 TaxID=2512164 RepID=UPI0010434BB0|nr:fatty acid--CoA ligase family protein [Streptomyces sp. BK205]TCR16024.1 acyl-CoA synthetase (AMP-forming)/AMP-acid ligase II [Streptomyces sp. BK205]
MTAARLADRLHRNARRYGDRPAVRVVDQGQCLDTSWARLAAMADAACGRADEIAPERPVLLALDNSPTALAALLGLASAGVGLAVLEADSRYLSDSRSVFHRIGADTAVLPGEALDVVSGYRVLTAGELVAPAGRRHLAAEPADPEVLQATSGSSGEPRLARQTLGNLMRGADLYRRVYSVTEDDGILLTVPAAHSFGMVAGLFTAVLTGATLWTFPRFSTQSVRRALDGGARVVLGTPLVHALLSRTRPPERAAVRVALSSGGPLEPEAAERAAEWLGAPVLQAYGSTETGLIACQRPGTGDCPPGCVGDAAPGVRLRLTGEGELAVRTDTMFLGYHGERSAVLGPDGFYRTGDTAWLDGDAHLHLSGRKGTFINVGGRKVNPQRVQRMLSEYPHLVESDVYGVGTLGGEEVRAAVVLTRNGDVLSLLAHCRERLAGYEVPQQVHVLDRLPRTGMGKVDRGRLPR